MGGRVESLSLVALALLLLAGFRARPAAIPPPSLTCDASALGKRGSLVQCDASGRLTGGEGRVVGLPLDLNRATEAELEALPGVGPKLAARILRVRAARGPFGTMDDLQSVAGLGPGKLKRLQGRVVVGSAEP